MGGLTSYASGRAAEAQVAQHYRDRGMVVCAERWRGKGGEIDLIAMDRDSVIFIEVKQSATHDSAAIQLSARQMGRIAQAAAEFLASQPAGQATPSRFDVALVDGSGVVLIHENAFGV